MRHEIETAPTDGEFVLLEDDASGKYAVARWSAEAGDWVEENGGPIQITATHWYPMPSGRYLPQEDNEASGRYPIDRPASWARRHDLSPFPLNRAAPRQPLASDTTAFTAQNAAIEAQTTPVDARRGPQARRRVAVLSIIATLVGAALIGMSFGNRDGPAIKQQSVSPSRVAQQADSVVLQLRADADQTRAWAKDVRQAAETTAQAQQSLEGQQRPETLSDEFAKAQRTINERNLQLRELANELAVARREIEKHVALSTKAAGEKTQLKQAADSAAALVRELAIARREIDAHAALAGKAADEAAQIKQAAESTTAELRQSLQDERARVEALARDLATARREIDTHATLARNAGDEAAQNKQATESSTAEFRQSLQRERDRADALAQDLATARREIDAHATLARDAGDEIAQIKQAAESTAAELRQSLRQERDRAEALARDLTTARLETDTHLKLWSHAADEVKQIKQVAAELRQSLQRERDRAEALARDIESVHRATDRRIAPEPAMNAQITQVEKAVETTAVKQPAVNEPQDSPDVARLLARASALLSQGSIGAARTVLERATEAGSARASFALAETYDPLILSRWGTYGTRGDAMRARELYAKAHAGGIQEAKDRINALPQ